jgi:hypothetical protein
MTNVLFDSDHRHCEWRLTAEKVIEVEGPIIDSMIGGRLNRYFNRVFESPCLHLTVFAQWMRGNRSFTPIT